MAHMDTVPICLGCKPTIDGDFVRSADPNTGLGADDRAGATVILSAALAILAKQIAASAADVFLAHSRRNRTLRRTARRYEVTRPTETGLQLGRRHSGESHRRRHRRLSDANRHSRLGQPRRRRAGIGRQRHRHRAAWPLPNCKTTAGTAKSSKANAAAPATSASSMAARPRTS